MEPSPPLPDMLRAARADLLIPLRLDALGFYAAKVGRIFSGASLLFVGSSAITSARAEGYANVRAAAM